MQCRRYVLNSNVSCSIARTQALIVPRKKDRNLLSRLIAGLDLHLQIWLDQIGLDRVSAIHRKPATQILNPQPSIPKPKPKPKTLNPKPPNTMPKPSALET